MANPQQTPKFKPDNQSGVYDEPGSAKTLSSSGLSRRESLVGGGGSPATRAASAGSLNQAEGSGGFYKKSANLGAKVAGKASAAAGPEAVVAQKTVQKIIGAFSRHKSGTAAGGAGVALFIFLAIFSAGFIVSHEIITLEKTFLKYEFKIESHFEKKVANKLMQKMICMQTKCKSGTDDDADKTAAAEDGNANPNPAAGEDLAADMESFPLTSKPVADALEAQGIKEVTGPTGNLEELEDTSNGANVTDDVASDTNGVADSIEAGLPEYSFGQETSFRAVVVEHAGVNEDPSPPADPDDSDKAVEDNIVKGATEEEIAGEASVTDNGKANGESAADYAAGQADAGAFDNMLNVADKDVDNGVPQPKLEEDVEDASSASPVFISNIASVLCGIRKQVSSASSQRVPKIDTLLIRHGMLLVSLADELKVGDLSGGALNKVMSLFNGDSSAAPTTNSNGQTVPAQASYPLSDSAAYQNASGNSGGIPMDSSALPTANAGTSIVNTINSILAATVIGSLVCQGEGSIFGSLLNGIANGTQLITGLVTGGLSQLALAGATFAGLQAIQHILVPEILRYFTIEGLDGLENAAQWGNNAGAGLNLASSDYGRSEGADPVTTPVASQISSEATQEQDVAESRLSWVDRTVALSNPDSLASHLLMDMPVGLAATINGAVSSLVRLPAILLHNLSSIFYSRAIAAVPSDPGQAAGITQYAFTDNEVGQYDPIANEVYLFTPVTFVDKIDKVDATIPHRIDALGNPNTYLLNGSGDEVDSSGNLITDDLLHCYVDSYVDLQENTLSGASGTPSSGISIAKGCQIPSASGGTYSLGDYDYTTNTPASSSAVDTYLDTTIASDYCYTLLYPNNLTVTIFPKCMQQVGPQVKDDIGHFRQYLVDVHVMKDYEGLVTNQ